MSDLSDFFQYQGFSEEESENIASLFVKKSFEKASYFVEEGKISKHLGFVGEGLFQYFTSKEGNEITTYVSGKNTFLASLSSFIGQIPSKENIRALMDGEVWLIHFDDIERLKTNSNQFKSFYIGVLEQLIVCIDDSKNKLITLTADERYELMLKDEPQLLQQIPLQYLASILGITPRHLSRIRKNVK